MAGPIELSEAYRKRLSTLCRRPDDIGMEARHARARYAAVTNAWRALQEAAAAEPVTGAAARGKLLGVPRVLIQFSTLDPVNDVDDRPVTGPMLEASLSAIYQTQQHKASQTQQYVEYRDSREFAVRIDLQSEIDQAEGLMAGRTREMAALIDALEDSAQWAGPRDWQQEAGAIRRWAVELRRVVVECRHVAHSTLAYPEGHSCGGPGRPGCCRWHGLPEELERVAGMREFVIEKATREDWTDTGRQGEEPGWEDEFSPSNSTIKFPSGARYYGAACPLRYDSLDSCVKRLRLHVKGGRPAVAAAVLDQLSRDLDELGKAVGKGGTYWEGYGGTLRG